MLMLAFLVVGCSGSQGIPKIPRTIPMGGEMVSPTTVDHATGVGCTVSSDGFVWYALPAGMFPPIDFSNVRCQTSTALDANLQPTIPGWAKAPASSQTIFVATSLQEAYSPTGTSLIEADAARSSVPVSWMIGNPQYLSPQGVSFYNQAHAANGDDVELEESPTLYALARELPWYAPSVSVEGAGRERNISKLTSLGNSAFWAITWNSHGTDNTSDEGAPWGVFCSDPSSYKRPTPDGSCPVVSFEWTARDLTRSFFTNTNPSGYSSEAAFSTDPDDLRNRGGFSDIGAAQYQRSLVDAYAAAGEKQPIVMMSQQETAEEGNFAADDDQILSALYDEVHRDGLSAQTLRTANTAAHTFASASRAIAFPFIAGGNGVSFDGAPFTPATIDFHDSEVGMTFISGHTMPSRVFNYALDPTSFFNKTLVQTMPTDPTFPKLESVVATNGGLMFSFNSPVSQHFAIALWRDPIALGAAQPNVTVAGRAGIVASFDLPAGPSQKTLICNCNSTVLPFSL